MLLPIATITTITFQVVIKHIIYILRTHQIVRQSPPQFCLPPKTRLCPNLVLGRVLHVLSSLVTSISKIICITVKVTVSMSSVVQSVCVLVVPVFHGTLFLLPSGMALSYPLLLLVPQLYHVIVVVVIVRITRLNSAQPCHANPAPIGLTQIIILAKVDTT